MSDSGSRRPESRWRARSGALGLAAALALASGIGGAAVTVPTDVQEPGTQPGQTTLEASTRCDNCHGGYAPAVEPARVWRGSMMAHAARDPLFWATVAIAEQDFDGAGDLCIRCHVATGWLEGRSTPTDGSALTASDAQDGVGCDLCHRMVNPDGSEHAGLQIPPFVANDGGSPPTAYAGGGMYVIAADNAKLGPYSDATARHQALQSHFHRSSALCGTCHDVSNPVVGDLAPTHGAQLPLAPGTYSGVPGSPVDGKAAFNNFPFAYGVVERTFSEHMASAFPTTRVASYASLPAELRDGAIEKAYAAAQLAGQGGDYADGEARFFTCQTCHMTPTVGQGCNKNPAVRTDLPLHDLTGGNTWAPDAIVYLDGLGRLLVGGGLTLEELAGLAEGKQRAQENLLDAASLTVTGDAVRIVNLTGHKLISGYPEGRRMWLNVRWLGAGGALLREDGAYGPITAMVGGAPRQVDTIVDLADPHLRVYEAHGGISQAWAARLLSVGVPGTLPLRFDRVTGAVLATLADAAAGAAGSAQESFHFVLNDVVVRDDRIPPYGMSYDEAVARNIRPVPYTQYGDPGPGGAYEHWDEVRLSPPAGAASATVRLLYQPTSWEYVQFLALANTGQVTFLAAEGANLLDAWLATGMAAPVEMASATWQASGPACDDDVDNDGDGEIDYPLDPECLSASDLSEVADCGDGLDNDADGAIDAADPGCGGPTSARENPQCDDGLDNDGDGQIDLSDSGCGGFASNPYEAPPSSCGLGGPELAATLAGLLLALARARRRRR